jgi:hypothetical protein
MRPPYKRSGSLWVKQLYGRYYAVHDFNLDIVSMVRVIKKEICDDAPFVWFVPQSHGMGSPKSFWQTECFGSIKIPCAFDCVQGLSVSYA